MLDRSAGKRFGQRDGDGGAAVEFAGDLQTAVLKFHQPAYQRQPDSGAFHTAAQRGVGPKEALAQLF